jgi:hypothetical protein
MGVLLQVTQGSGRESTDDEGEDPGLREIRDLPTSTERNENKGWKAIFF